MTRQSLKGYLDVVKGIAKHLKRTHGLVEERQYVKRYVLIGLTFGLSLILLCLILLNFGVTLLALNVTVLALITRVIFGYIVGHFLDRRARKRGRVL
jgi:putative flippase GtrA